MPSEQAPATQTAIARHTNVLNNILEAVGGTPCVRMNRVPQDHGIKCEVIAKCEFMNPGGSVKDRIGVRMVADAEASGRIKPGDTLIEPSSGNTGIGLSLSAAAKGYKMIVTMPTKMSQEKTIVMEALGTEVIRVPLVAYDHPDSLISVAKRLEAEKGYHLLDQYANPGNPNSHYDGTAEEILAQCDNKIDMIVIGAGTGGTITGIAKKLKERLPNIIVVGVDPVGSILADPSAPAENTPYQVEGIGYDFVPKVCDRQYVDRWVKSRDKESFDLAREIHAKEAMLCGGSSGSAMWGVLEAAKDLEAHQRCVVVFPDNIRNYMTKFPDRNWRIEYGLEEGEITRPTYNQLEKRVKELEAKLAAAAPAAGGEGKTKAFC
ncbi:cystathionine beta-synthase, putative [Bodo saltans]|uniref:cystathionine beta-synthase n=1 Tax=Bodo saltans TaxID=75058 RepID=A0A0S4JNJ6_BODSA|nr:cystathionine beta-synthase, putative [Bodo saltans]|eukprot:CUG92011.1 cystathionine beta-synthase, putative [Bodo saltans]